MWTLDCQVHAYERDRPERPWFRHIHGPAEVTGLDMVTAMDAAGVDGALLVSPWAVYGYDDSYIREVYAAFPGRFRLIKPVDFADPGVEDVIAAWARTEAAVGIRIMLNDLAPDDAADSGLNRILTAAARYSLPVNFFCPGRLNQVGGLIARHPDTAIVIDHLGLAQPYAPPVPQAPFSALPALLRLAAFDNVVVKISGVCTLSGVPFPFEDVWGPIARVLDAFSVERCMWGTDWTRALDFASYREAVDAFRLTDRLSGSDRAALMGRTLRTVYDWD